MPARIATVPALLTLACLVGCEGGLDTGADGFSVRDSASVRIVTNTGPDRLLRASEVLRIGTVDGDPEYLFDGIRSVRLASDGAIWVSDSDPSIRRYDGTGVYLNSAGAQGEGPGESARGYGDVWPGDSTVLTFPYSPPAMQLFTWAGEFLSSRPARDGNRPALFPVGPSEDSWFFRRDSIPTGDGPRTRSVWTLWRGPISGDLDSVMSLPGNPRTQRAEGGWGNGSYLDGFSSLAVANNEIYYSDPTRYEVTVFGQDGQQRRIIRRVVDPITIPPGIMDRVEAELEASWLENTGAPINDFSRSRMLPALQPSSIPDHLPFLDLVLPTHEGAIWVRRADQHPDPAAKSVAVAMGYIRSAWLDRWKAESVFDVFAEDGSYRGTVRLPADFTPLDATSDRIYGTITDDLDVHYVVAFELDTSIR